MSEWDIDGLTIKHCTYPRFRLTLEPKPDGTYITTNVHWIDEPPMDAALLARLMREAGDAWREHNEEN